MNCFSAFTKVHWRWSLLAALGLAAACGVPESESADRANTREYSLRYTLTPDPTTSSVRVSLRLQQPRDLVREISFPVNADISDIEGNGDLEVGDGRATWSPPADGGLLEWSVIVHEARGSGAFDALLTPQWGLFRAEDVIPRARTRTLKGSVSRTTMRFDLPAGWSAITEYSAARDVITVERPDRRFDEPTGWIAIGDLGVRRERIAGTRVAVVAPRGQQVRRMDILALLNWTLPELNAVLPDALPRLTVVSAGDPMWRGGLSAPASLFLHADRPLISENATSSLLHEVMHTALGIRPLEGYDWIAEGLAEYYSIELLRRGKAITASRAVEAFAKQASWGKSALTLCGKHSTGATTALAVTTLKALDLELQDASDGAANLDALLPLLADTEVDLAALVLAANQLVGSTPDTLHSEALPGCRSIEPDRQEN
jgi:hypothetical protein